jgi:hypothetical protein
MSLLSGSSVGPLRDEYLTPPNQAKRLAATFKLFRISLITKKRTPLRYYLLNPDLLGKLLKVLVIVAHPYGKCKQKEFD